MKRAGMALPRFVRGLSRAALPCLLASVLSWAAVAQPAPEIRLDGPDWLATLEAAARREGALTIYTATPVEDVTAVTNAFTKAYGIPVKIWRGSSEDVLRRAVTEIRSGRNDADVIETNGPELEALHREKILRRIDLPVVADIYPDAAPAHREWVGSRLNIIVPAYNTDLVREADAPKSWSDLLDPRWKGKIGLEAEAYDWLAVTNGSLAETPGEADLLARIAKANGLSLRKGHTLLTNLTASGEVPVALTAYLYKVDQMAKEGAPIRRLALLPSVARINGLGIVRTARHPNAAVLFQHFTLTEGQKVLAERGFTPTNTRVTPLPVGLDIKVVQSASVLDQMARWRQTFDRTVR